MQRGYIKLWRKTIDSRIFKDPNLLKVWLWCLMKSSHRGRWVDMATGKGIIEVWIDPGQFIFGRESAAKDLGMKPSSVRNRINKLKSLQNIDIKADRQYSIITIIKWDIYQPVMENQDSDQDSEEDRQRTGKGQAKDTNKNVKNVKNKERPTVDHLKNHLIKKIQENGNGLIKYQPKLIEFFKYRMNKPVKDKYKTEKAIDGLIREAVKCLKQYSDLDECLDITMERNWLTPDPKYLEGRVKENQKRPSYHKRLTPEQIQEITTRDA